MVESSARVEGLGEISVGGDPHFRSRASGIGTMQRRPHTISVAMALLGAVTTASSLADQPDAARPIRLRTQSNVPLEGKGHRSTIPVGRDRTPFSASDIESREDTITSAAGAPDAIGNTDLLIYGNTLGEFLFAPGPGIRLSDDITTITDASCGLARFEFLVSGNANGLGSGPFAVDFALYDGCPDLDGAVIPGTQGHFDAPDEGDYLVTVEIPPDVHISVSYPLWLSLTFSRANAGWYAGAPALTGFSDDVFDFPGHNCGVSFGRFPTSPHGSFWARVYGRGDCEGVFQAYRANSPVQGSLTPGAGTLIADDIQLNVDQCEMRAYEVGIAGTGSFTFDLRIPGSESAIPETQRTFLTSGTSPELARFEFDPPIPVPPELWVTVQVDDANAEVLLLGRRPAVGTSDESYRVFQGGVWTVTPLPDDWFYFAIQASVTCAGAAPIGACCDMTFPNEAGDSVCRHVPEMNCPFPRWVGGAGCDPDPFDPPCGTSACCLGDGRCEDRTDHHCEVGGASWHRGEFCDSREGECPFVCVYSEQPCSRPHVGGGCLDPSCCDTVCSQDPFCCAVEWDTGCATTAMIDCTVPPENDECWSDLPGFGALEVAISSNTKGGVLNATENPSDPGFCCHGDTAGAQGFGTVWFTFTATDTSALLSTCESNAPADDSLIQVLRPENTETEEAACNSLVPIACNDDVLFCSASGSNSELCVTGLVPGETYYVMVAAKTHDARGLYRLDIESPCSVSLPSPSCPCGEVRWLDPPDGVVDARQPHLPHAAGQPLGIDEVLVAAPSNADSLDCWRLCETADDGSENEVANVIDNGDGTYTLGLDRPLTPGAATTITYAADNGSLQTGIFISHPANVNGDGEADSLDVTAVINDLNGTSPPPWGKYSADCNHSGSTTPADLLCVIDLLNGADAFHPGWNGSPKPTADGLCP